MEWEFLIAPFPDHCLFVLFCRLNTAFDRIENVLNSYALRYLQFMQEIGSANGNDRSPESQRDQNHR